METQEDSIDIARLQRVALGQVSGDHFSGGGVSDPVSASD